MEKLKLYLLGTEHTSEKSKDAIKNIFSRYKFDALLVEGVQHRGTKLFQKEPFLVWMIKVWLWHLDREGSESRLVHKLAEKHNIPEINMDTSLNEMIEYFHESYHNAIFIISVLTIYYISPNVLTTFGSIMLVEAIYFLYFVFKAGIQFRDELFYKNIKETVDCGLYDSILIICGKNHTRSIKKRLDIIDLTKNI